MNEIGICDDSIREYYAVELAQAIYFTLGPCDATCRFIETELGDFDVTVTNSMRDDEIVYRGKDRTEATNAFINWCAAWTKEGE